eukprot:916958-Rhodomonas_salina.1
MREVRLVGAYARFVQVAACATSGCIARACRQIAAYTASVLDAGTSTWYVSTGLCIANAIGHAVVRAVGSYAVSVLDMPQHARRTGGPYTAPVPDMP